VIASILEEEYVDAQEGSADSGEEQVCVKDIVASESREKMIESIQGDSNLASARALATK